MSADRRPPYEELAALVVGQAEQIARLEGEVAELKRQLGQNSRNSSKPPSSDSPFVKPAPMSLRRKSGPQAGREARASGGDVGAGRRSEQAVAARARPVFVVRADLADAAEVGAERRQVFDLPPMTVQVSEHQLVTRRCCCGATTCSTAPVGVRSPVQYGPRVSAIVLYLYVGQLLSKKRTAQALAELFGTPVSEATVAAMTRRASDSLDGFLEQVTDRVAEAEVAGLDETGLRVAGKLHWVHCARTEKYTLITCHPKRGRNWR